jgi:hypothetical protein
MPPFGEEKDYGSQHRVLIRAREMMMLCEAVSGCKKCAARRGITQVLPLGIVLYVV